MSIVGRGREELGGGGFFNQSIFLLGTIPSLPHPPIA